MSDQPLFTVIRVNRSYQQDKTLRGDRVGRQQPASIRSIELQCNACGHEGLYRPGSGPGYFTAAVGATYAECSGCGKAETIQHESP